jgi:5-methylcytosine-specific restriction enzyme subunit McrC
MSCERVQIRLTEWSQATPQTHSELKDLPLSGPADLTRQIELLRQRGMLEVDDLRTGLRIRTRAHVGRIVLGPLEITISPKLPRTPLMSLLRYAYGASSLQRSSRVAFSTEDCAFQDLLVEQLLDEAEFLVARGLQSRYMRKSELLGSPHGRLEMTRLAREPMTSPRLWCSHHPRVLDWLPNQMLLAGLRLASRLTASVELRSSLSRIVRLLNELASPADLCDDLFSRWKRERSRLTRAYEPALRLVELLWRGAGLSLEKDREIVALDGFLLDMNRFFQSLLSRFLNENLVGFTIRDEHRLQHVLTWIPGQNPRNRPHPTPRPDFAVLHDGRVVRFLDAKYRDLWNTSLPPHMLYQLALYATTDGAENCSVMLYPTTESDAKDAAIAVRDPSNGSAIARVILRPINLLDLARLTSQEPPMRRSIEARRWATP